MHIQTIKVRGQSDQKLEWKRPDTTDCATWLAIMVGKCKPTGVRCYIYITKTCARRQRRGERLRQLYTWSCRVIGAAQTERDQVATASRRINQVPNRPRGRSPQTWTIIGRFVYLLWCPKERFAYRTTEDGRVGGATPTTAHGGTEGPFTHTLRCALLQEAFYQRSNAQRVWTAPYIRGSLHLQSMQPFCNIISKLIHILNWYICLSVRTSLLAIVTTINQSHRVGHRLVTIILSNVNRFFKKPLEDFWVNLQLNGY